ncbi:MAG: hypothetical protein HC828_02045 [Blastochloris sp.]|nr:hypothetical protein [Blastochloris sp.]
MAVKSRNLENPGDIDAQRPPEAKPAPKLEPKPEPKPKAGGGCIAIIGWVGLWLAVAAFGGAIWAINGGFSVQGLEVIANAFNEAGRIFWRFASRWTFGVPGSEGTQPIIPWAGVVSSSILQVVVVLLRLLKRRIPPELVVAAVVLSVYDYSTTGFGLYTVPWAQAIGIFPTALIAFVLTFILEVIVAILLRRAISAFRTR